MGMPLLWFLLGTAFLAVELAYPTLVLGFFGIGAWVAACAALTGLAVGWQVVIFIAASLLCSAAGPKPPPTPMTTAAAAKRRRPTPWPGMWAW